MPRDKTGEYRAVAQDCVDVASRTNDQPRRSRLLHMALMWLRLAEQAEKNDKTDLVYETPTGDGGMPDTDLCKSGRE